LGKIEELESFIGGLTDKPGAFGGF